MSNETKKAAVKKPIVRKLTPKKEAVPMNGAIDASEGPMVDVPVEPTQDPNTPRQLSIGEQLIGCNFEIPAEEINMVVHVKMLCAELCNILTRELEAKGEVTPLHHDMYKTTLFEISNAQMNIVKTMTFKN